MQVRVSTAAVALAIAVMAAGLPDTSTVVDARPMHAAIVSKYHRYLAEKDNVTIGLKKWLKKWGRDGPKNGYIPVTESRSLDDELEDQRQRFYLTQEQIYEAREANPMAEFSTDGPFTLMTMDEFKQFLSNSHVDEADKTEAPEIEKPKTLSNKQNHQNDTPSSEESKNSESKNSDSKNKESKNDGGESKKTWAPATEGPTVIAAMRRLRSSGKSQYAFNGGTDYSADAEKGYQSTSDTYTQTTQPTYQGTGSNGGNTNTNTNGAWNFGDVSKTDSTQVGTVSTGSSTGSSNQAWSWWGNNGWGYNGTWWSNNNWWNGNNTWWSNGEGSNAGQWTPPPSTQWTAPPSSWIPTSGSSNSQWTPPPDSGNSQWTPTSGSSNSQWTPSAGSSGNQWSEGSSNNNYDDTNQWTEPPSTDETPATQPPTTPAPTSAPTDPPTDPPATDPPVTEAPATDPPATDPPATKAPKTAAPAPAPVPATKKKSTTTELKASETSTTTAKDSDSDSVDWSKSGCMNPPGLQGQCGSCWAFASISALETAQCIAKGDKKATKYSEQQLVSCDTKDYGCNGGAPVYAMEFLRDNGICTESSYPYTSVEGGTAAACSKTCTPTKSGITEIGQLKAGDESALLSTVKQQPVIASVTSNNIAWKQYTGGVITSCDTATVDHAVLVVGYDATTIKIKNSWGTDWGEDGYVRISRSPKDMGTCAVLTDMSYPKV